MKIPQFKTKKIKDFFGKLPGILGEHQFIIALILIFFALILGGLSFYKFGVLAERKEPQILEKPLHFNEKAFQEILKIWEDRQKKFEETNLKEYPDPFRGLTK